MHYYRSYPYMAPPAQNPGVMQQQQLQNTMQNMQPMPVMENVMHDMQSIPSMQCMPGMQTMPSVQTMPGMENMQYTPMIPATLPGILQDNMTSYPQSTMENMNHPQEMHEILSQFKPGSVTAPIADLSIYKYPENLKTALQYIQEALEGESEDRQFYDYLISIAPTEEEKEIIRGIRDDEIGHFSLFRQIYYLLTGRVLPAPKETKFTAPKSYCEGLKKALIGEQAAAKKYRSIYFALQDRTLMNVLFQIISDELRHGILYNYLYSKNNCNV